MAAIRAGTGRKLNVPSDIPAPRRRPADFGRYVRSGALPGTVIAWATSLGIRLGIIAGITWKTDAP